MSRRWHCNGPRGLQNEPTGPSGQPAGQGREEVDPGVGQEAIQKCKGANDNKGRQQGKQQTLQPQDRDNLLDMGKEFW